MGGIFNTPPFFITLEGLVTPSFFNALIPYVIQNKMFTDEEGLKQMLEMNKHTCRDCGKKFVNCKGMAQHMKKFKHYKYDLQK